jgi:hypothetical protein
MNFGTTSSRPSFPVGSVKPSIHRKRFAPGAMHRLDCCCIYLWEIVLARPTLTPTVRGRYSECTWVRSEDGAEC